MCDFGFKESLLAKNKDFYIFFTLYFACKREGGRAKQRLGE
jgi:hypothetical protein